MVARLTLIKFIEYQQRTTPLNKIPIVVKIAILLYCLSSLFLPLPRMIIWLSLLSILAGLSSLLLIFYRDPAYLLEVYAAYFMLFIIVYFSSLLVGSNIKEMLTRLLYIYSTAFSSIFFFATTKIKDLENFMRKIRVPETIIRFFVITWNLIPSTYYELQLIKIAQEARGAQIKGGILGRIKNSLLILVPFMYVLLIRSRLLELSIKARGAD